jgi:hypothetical protein
MAGNPKARRGHSKEKRSDCPLVTLGLVLDGSGFVRRSAVFAGNVGEGQTLAQEYRRHGTALQVTHPYLAETLEGLARSYEANGRREDDQAGLRREHY